MKLKTIGRKIIIIMLMISMVFQFSLVQAFANDEVIITQVPEVEKTAEALVPVPEVSAPEVAITQEPVALSTPIVVPTPEMTPTPTPTPTLVSVETINNIVQVMENIVVPTWSVNGNEAKTNLPVELNQTYVAPQNNHVKVKFTKLPETAGILMIKEIKLSPNEQKVAGSLDSIVYDISSDMTDSSFEYNLTLPLPANLADKNVTVKSSENIDGLKNAQTVTETVTQKVDTIKVVGLNHFTVFVLTTPMPDNTQSVLINEIMVNDTDTSEWVELYNNTDSSIDLTGWTIKDTATATKSLSSLGLIPARGFAVFSHASGWLNNSAPETITINNGITNIDSINLNSNGGIEILHYPLQGESVARANDGANDWTIFTNPTKGLANSDQVKIAFADISTQLANNGIANNLSDVNINNYTSFNGLYFEKSIDGVKMGKLTFTSTLDLSDLATQTYLQNLGEKMDMSAGKIGLNVTGSDLAGMGAEIKFYNLDQYGLPQGLTDQQVTDYINSKLIAKDDSGNIVTKSEVIPLAGAYIGACGVGETECHVFTIGVNHFTTYEIDTTAPVITLNGGNPQTVEKGGIYQELGAIATDNVDANFAATANGSVDMNTSGDYTITYTATDSVGNQASPVTRIVEVRDTIAPVVSLNGVASLSIDKNSSYIDAGATATDNIDGNITTNIVVTNPVDTMTLGTYTVKYNVRDVAGNSAIEVARTVDVVLAKDQIEPSRDGNALLDDNASTVVVTDPTQAINIEIALNTTDPEIDYSAFINNGTGILPETNINSTAFDVSIPGGARVTSADSSWDGIMAAPKVTTVDLSDNQTLESAIEVGFASAKLSFDKGVRVVFAGQAGKRIGYTRAGEAFTEITNICVADNQATGDTLVADSDCKIDVAGDLVIWTKHFTKFATYTQSTSVSSGKKSHHLLALSSVVVAQTSNTISSLVTGASSQNIALAIQDAVIQTSDVITVTEPLKKSETAKITEVKKDILGAENTNKKSKNNNWIWYVLSGLVLAGAGFYIWRRNRKED